MRFYTFLVIALTQACTVAVGPSDTPPSDAAPEAAPDTQDAPPPSSDVAPQPESSATPEAAPEAEAAPAPPVISGCYVDDYLTLYLCDATPAAGAYGAVTIAGVACAVDPQPCIEGTACEIFASWQTPHKPGTCRTWTQPAGYSGSGPVLFSAVDHPAK